MVSTVPNAASLSLFCSQPCCVPGPEKRRHIHVQAPSTRSPQSGHRDGSEVVKVRARSLSSDDVSKPSSHEITGPLRAQGKMASLRIKMRGEMNGLKKGVKASVKKIVPQHLSMKGAKSASTRFPLPGVSSRTGVTVSNTEGATVEPNQYRPWIDLQKSSNPRPPVPSSPGSYAQDKSCRQTDIKGYSAIAVSPSKTKDGAGRIWSLFDRFDRQVEEYTTRSTNLPSSKAMFVSVQMAAFHFSNLVSTNVLSGFAPTNRVLIICNNCLKARQDMVRLGYIWSQLVGPASIIWALELNNSLLDFEDADAKSICQKMEEGLHRLSFWAMAVKQSANRGEGVMGPEWWRDFEAKLLAVGDLDFEGIAQQLIAVGSKYIHVPSLEATIRAMKVLEEGEGTSVRHDSKMDYEEEAKVFFGKLEDQSTLLPRMQQINVASSTHEGDISGRPDSPSSDIVREVNAVLEAAVIGEQACSTAPSTRRNSLVPRPLTIRKSHPALSEEVENCTSPPNVVHNAEEELPPPVAKEHSAASLINIEDINIEDPVYPGPPEMSNKARGKLPVVRKTFFWPKPPVPTNACIEKLSASFAGLSHNTITGAQVLTATSKFSEVSEQSGQQTMWAASANPSGLTQRREVSETVLLRDLTATINPSAIEVKSTADVPCASSEANEESKEGVGIRQAPFAPVTVAKALTFSRTNVGVRHRHRMPGAYPASDSE